jgi:hypothetical protein
MPNVDITDSDYSRLQRLATPFVDTPATTIGRLLDFFEANRPTLSATATLPVQATTKYSERLIPPLVHTKILDAQLGDEAPERMTWDALVRLSINSVLKKLGSQRDLYKVTGANVVEGSRDVDGYKPVPAHGYSYQGVSAEDAVKIISRCAKYLQITARVEFEWRNKEKAHKPGERGVIVLGE